MTPCEAFSSDGATGGGGAEPTGSHSSAFTSSKRRITSSYESPRRLRLCSLFAVSSATCMVVVAIPTIPIQYNDYNCYGLAYRLKRLTRLLLRPWTP